MCHDYASGGLSPSPSLLSALKSEITIPIYVMIRVHSRDFFCSETEFEEMKDTLLNLKTSGADGFVFGILKPADSPDDRSTIRVDITRNKELVLLASGKPCTFHRAFDCLPYSSWGSTIQDVRECGFSSILTSGGPSGKDAIDCVDRLSNLIPRHHNEIHKSFLQRGHAPQIIVGGGVRSTNLHALTHALDAEVYHSSALTALDDVVSVEELRNMLRIIKG